MSLDGRERGDFVEVDDDDPLVVVGTVPWVVVDVGLDVVVVEGIAVLVGTVTVVEGDDGVVDELVELIVDPGVVVGVTEGIGATVLVLVVEVVEGVELTVVEVLLVTGEGVVVEVLLESINGVDTVGRAVVDVDVDISWAIVVTNALD